MKRYTVLIVVASLMSLGAAATAQAGAIEEVMKRQNNGMWEMKPPGGKAKPMLFCVTDDTKIDGLRETREAVKDLGCKTEKDTLSGDRYEIVLACSSADPNVGNFRMVMSGTARSDYMTGETVITGGGPMIRMLFPKGKEGGGENRWVRPCKAGEKPGLQGS
jgi:hypothetical protein